MMPYAFELALPGESDHDFGLRAAKAVEDAILEAGADKVAAFIGEPIMGAGGVKIPPASYWPEIQRICRKYDVLLMLDEVITGYGRTGELVRRADVRHRARHDHHGQGADLGLSAAVGAAGRRPHRRDAGREGRRVLPRLHLFRASGRLRGGAEEPRDHRARRAGRARPRPTPDRISRRRCEERIAGHPLVGEVRDVRPDGRDRDRQGQGDARAVPAGRQSRPSWCATMRSPTA